MIPSFNAVIDAPPKPLIDLKLPAPESSPVMDIGDYP